jgi:TonB family protein
MIAVPLSLPGKSVQSLRSKYFRSGLGVKQVGLQPIVPTLALFSGVFLSGWFVKWGKFRPCAERGDGRFGGRAYTSAMTRRLLVGICFFLIGFLPVVAQRSSSELPSQLVIARHTFFDFGPPFDFYEVITVESRPDGLNVERALVTPAGDACFSPPAVEVKTGSMHASMTELLKGQNPCDIPEKDLHKELKRCKHCLKFSGADVTMHVSCRGKERAIRMDILDRDMFDPGANTPKQTSWTMTVMSSLDDVLGPGVMEKPMFSSGKPEPNSQKVDIPILRRLRSGQFDTLFDSKPQLSELARQAAQPLPSPNIVLLDYSPVAPLEAELPGYPPIAKVAHVDGQVSVSFHVTPDGRTGNISFEKQTLMQSATQAAVEKWRFPATTEGHDEHVTLEFKLNCPLSAQPQ